MAPARVDSIWDKYLGLETKVRSSFFASSIPATPLISTSSDPRSLQPSFLAISPNFMPLLTPVGNTSGQNDNVTREGLGNAGNRITISSAKTWLKLLDLLALLGRLA